MNPLLMELKKLLTETLNSENSSARKKALEGSMELLTELEMDISKIEKAIKFEIKGESEEANKIIEKELDEINEEEYNPSEEKNIDEDF
ncbi:hypothetical protein J4436_00440 [Candidatus Woesearchaeota archaeon]|nr:hypothetical protein [Candidatus Woesearchaeota archaeon]